MFCADTTDGNDLLYRIGFVPYDHIASLRIKEVLEDATLVAILIVERVGLNLSNSDVCKTPDLRIGIQPPITTILLTGSRCDIQFDTAEVFLVECSRKLISQFPYKAAILVFSCITARIENRPPLSGTIISGVRRDAGGLTNSSCQCYRARIIEVLCLAVFHSKLSAGSHATIILHALHDFQRTRRKDGFILQQLAPILNREAGIKVCAIPAGSIRSSILLRVIPADVETDVDGQSLQFRIRIAGIGQLRLEQVHQFGILFEGHADFIIELQEIPDVIGISTFFEAIVRFQLTGDRFYFTEFVDVILIRVAEP